MAVKKGKNQRKKRKSGAWPIAAVVLCALAVVVFLTGRGRETGAPSEDSTEAGTDGGVRVIAEGGALTIPADDISSVASFYTLEVDGTRMEVLAVRDSAGNIRTAFNTCQICYDSGYGYYVQSGDALVCQNCGNRFTVDQVEIESGGCNPWPIFPENKTVTVDSVVISYDFLKESAAIFSNWKAQS